MNPPQLSWFILRVHANRVSRKYHFVTCSSHGEWNVVSLPHESVKSASKTFNDKKIQETRTYYADSERTVVA